MSWVKYAWNDEGWVLNSEGEVDEPPKETVTYYKIQVRYPYSYGKRGFFDDPSSLIPARFEVSELDLALELVNNRRQRGDTSGYVWRVVKVVETVVNP